MRHFYDIVLNEHGVPVPNATVSVYLTGTQTLAALFSDDGLTTKSNPTFTDTAGRFNFYVEDGRYDLTVTGSNITSITQSNVEISDVTEFTSGDSSWATQQLNFKQLAAGTQPSSGFTGLYSKTVDKRLYYMDDTGSEIGPLGVGGGGGTPGGANNSLQKNASGIFGAANITDDGTQVVVSESFYTKGPNPEIDISAFGPVFVDSFVPPTNTTGSITGGSSTLTLAAAAGFINGHGIRIDRAGPATTLTTPTAGSACLPKGILNGTTSHTYTVVLEDINGALTASGTACTVTNAPSTLGINSVTVVQGVTSDGATTYTTSVPHNFEVGRMVEISGFTGTTFGTVFTLMNGVKRISSTPTSTTFVVKEQAFVNFTDTSGGVAKVKGYVQVTWTPYQQNVVRAWIYRDGVLAGCAKGADPIFMDEGVGINLGIFGWGVLFAYLPSSTPSSAVNGYLSTTVLSGGGTNSLTLATPAVATITSQKVLHDNKPLLAAAIASLGASSSGTVVIPNVPTPNTGVIFTSNIKIAALGGNNTLRLVFRGPVHLHGTMVLPGNINLQGEPGPTAAVSFHSGMQQTIFGAAMPLFLLQGAGQVQFKNLNLSTGLQQQSLIVSEPTSLGAQSGYQVDLDTVSLGGSEGADALYISKSGAFSRWNSVNFVYSSGNGLSSPCVRLTLGSPALSPAPVSGAIHATGLNFLQGSGIAEDTYYNETGGGTGTVGTNFFENFLCEGLTMPAFQFNVSGAFTSSTYFKNIVIADPITGYGTPGIDIYTPTTFQSVSIDKMGAFIVLVAANSGIAGLSITESSGLINVDNYILRGIGASNSELPTPTGTGILNTYTRFKNSAVLADGVGFVGISLPRPTTAPTVTVSAGGSVPLGTHFYSCSFYGWNNGESPIGQGTPVNVTTGNQTVNVTCNDTLPAGARGYFIQRDGVRVNISGCTTPFTGSFPAVDVFASACGNSSSKAGYGAISYLNSKEMGSIACRLNGESFSSSPRAEKTVFLPGALTSTWTGASWTLDKAIIVTRVQVQLKTAPVTCSPNAIVRVTDGASPINLTLTAASNDSGALSQTYSAGSTITTAVQTAAAGCATAPADANVILQYRMA